MCFCKNVRNEPIFMALFKNEHYFLKMVYIMNGDVKWIFCQGLHLSLNILYIKHYNSVLRRCITLDKTTLTETIWKWSDTRLFGFGIIHCLDFSRYNWLFEIKIKTLRFWTGSSSVLRQTNAVKIHSVRHIWQAI